MPPQVWLGLAGDVVSVDAPPDHYSTRIGGQPVFPGSTPPQWPAGCQTCRVCGAPLSLVLQAYAPLPDVPDRVLLLLGCTKAGCGKSPGCWQALRCQLQPQKQQPLPQQQPQVAQQDCGEGLSQPLQPATGKSATATAATVNTGFDAAPPADDWGFGGSADGSSNGFGGWDAAQPSAGSNGGDAFDFSDLTSALTATVQQHQQHQQKEAQKKKEQRKQHAQAAAAGAADATAAAAATAAVAAVAAAPEAAAVSSSRGSAGPELPEFYLYSDLEPDGSSSKAIPSKELQHVQQLLAAYEATEGASSAAATTGASSSSSSSSHQKLSAAAAAAAAAAAGGGDGGDAEGEGGASWAGEEYEPDSVQCMQRSYLKFMKRIARQPQQCARYSLGGPLLWPQAQPPQPQPCVSCGGPSVLELQLMPALSQLVLEAAGMLQEQGSVVDAAAVNAAANWDWCTVAVFTCQASCGSSSSGVSWVADDSQQCSLTAEQVVLVTEAECESQQASAGQGPAAAQGDVAASDGEQ